MASWLLAAPMLSCVPDSDPEAFQAHGCWTSFGFVSWTAGDLYEQNRCSQTCSYQVKDAENPEFELFPFVCVECKSMNSLVPTRKVYPGRRAFCVHRGAAVETTLKLHTFCDCCLHVCNSARPLPPSEQWWSNFLIPGSIPKFDIKPLTGTLF